MYNDGTSAIVVLRLLQHTNQIYDGCCIGRVLVLEPVCVLVLLDSPTFVDLRVSDRELPHRVRGELRDLCQLHKHVTVLTDLLVGPITDALLL